MKKSLIILIFFIFSGYLLVGSVFFLKNISSNKNEFRVAGSFNSAEGKNVIHSSIDKYYADSQLSSKTMAAIGKSDSRPVIIDNFLAKHNSPMTGMGSVFVKYAELYGLDYRLMPAIAFQESTLGKRMPKGSHNAWGWAIYTGEQSGAHFRDWEHAIEVVARGLKTDYIDRGLVTVDAIMTRYSDSGGSWADGVKFAMDEMKPK